MATDAQTLLEETTCYQCNAANGYSLEMIKLGLLRQLLLANNPNAMTDAKSLLQAASCYQCYAANSYMLKMLELGLLQQLVLNGGGGGGPAGFVTCGTGAPTTAPTSSCGFYIQTDSVPAGQVWEYYSGAWHS